MKKAFLVGIIMAVLSLGIISTQAIAEEPAPGKQVPLSIELPASGSLLTGGGDFVRRLGEPKPLDAEKKEKIGYFFFLPENYDTNDKEKAAPLLLFLHGMGERGNNVERIKAHGPPKLLADPETAKDWPFITVSPQCPDGKYWSPAQLLLLIEHVEKEYNVDKNRIYVTGLSMGGFGTWMLAAEAPERFAAAAPICGGGHTENAKKLVDMPIWVFHGDADNVVPVTLSKNYVEAIEKAGGKKVKLTTYPGVGHDSWTQTYKNKELYKFFLDNPKK